MTYTEKFQTLTGTQFLGTPQSRARTYVPYNCPAN
jgi:hypothetical protein